MTGRHPRVSKWRGRSADSAERFGTLLHGLLARTTTSPLHARTTYPRPGSGESRGEQRGLKPALDDRCGVAVASMGGATCMDM